MPKKLKKEKKPVAAKPAAVKKYKQELPKSAAPNRAARRAALREAYEATHGPSGPPTDQTQPPEKKATIPAPEHKPRERVAKPQRNRDEEETVTEEVATEPTVAETKEPATGGFADLGLSKDILTSITTLGFEEPTPIQAQAIPALLAGRDIIGQAQTGTGKTAAFGLPIVQRIDISKLEPQTLVLAPTRELAVQVAGGIHDYGKDSGLRVVPVYGGQPIDRQFRALAAGAHVVVGTPGRLLDHLRRGSLSFKSIRFCVLDEADEMLALGFLEEVEEILSALPKKRQLAFFSATMPPRIKALTERFLSEPEHIEITAKQRTVEAIEQTYYEVPKGKKQEALARVLDMETPGPTIVFCHTRQETHDLAEALRLRGYNAEALNGEMGQADRDRVLKRFKDGLADLLVATDVAARGLDIETVTHVINYSIPWDVEQYIHRIGRTGRAGRSGDAITLVESKDRRKLKLIERMTGVTMKPARIPTAADIAARRRDAFIDTLREALATDDYHAELDTVEELTEEFDVGEIAAAALHLLWLSRHKEESDTADLMADHEQPESGMTRLWIGLGRQDGLRPGELVAAIANGTGLPGKAIGAIDILDRSSFVEVPTKSHERILEVLKQSPLRGKRAKVDVATPRRK